MQNEVVEQENVCQDAHGCGLAVVVVTFNSATVLPGLLDSLPAGLDGLEAELIVVDNDSRDNSVVIAQSHPTAPKVIRMGRNAGYAAGINAAAAMLHPDTDLLVLNPDIRLAPASMRRLIGQLQDPSVGVAVPQILNEDGTVSLSIRRMPSLVTSWSDALLGTTVASKLGIGETVRDRTLYQRGGRIPWATGAALIISAQARRRVGSWDESFFLYSEEVDYLHRVHQCGLAVLYDPGSRMIHIGGEYHENPFLSALMTTNRIELYGRHHGWAKTILFRLSIVVGESMRAMLGSGHRAALRAALTR